MAQRKTTSRVTEPKSAPDAPTDVASWKAAAKGSPLQVPSGNVCLVRKPDSLATFMSKGAVPNPLLPIVAKALEGKEQDPKDMMQEVVKNPELLNDMIAMMDNVVMSVVVQPLISPIPTDDDGEQIPFGDSRRNPNVLYVDEVQAEDKQFIFQWAMGGTKDLETFRHEQAQTVAAVAPVAGVGKATKRAAKPRQG